MKHSFMPILKNKIKTIATVLTENRHKWHNWWVKATVNGNITSPISGTLLYL